MILGALAFVLGLIVGWYARLIKDYLQTLVDQTKRRPEPSSGVTAGAYATGHSMGSSGAIVNPKTPQQLDWEAKKDLERFR